MATYWLSFRLEENDTYAERYTALITAVDMFQNLSWAEPTSFIIFESAFDLDVIAADLKATISPAVDLFLIRNLDKQEAIMCGQNGDQDITILMPYLQVI